MTVATAKEKRVRVEFVREVTPFECEGEPPVIGEVIECSERSAWRWVEHLGAARYTDAEVGKPEPAPEAEPPRNEPAPEGTAPAGAEGG